VERQEQAGGVRGEATRRWIKRGRKRQMKEKVRRKKRKMK
jgi:hypothetical protein